MQKLMNEKIIPKIMAFINLKGIQAIKDGMVYSMPLLIVGSVFLIITNFPVQAVVDVLEETGIKAVLEQANGATFNISAMIAVLGIYFLFPFLHKYVILFSSRAERILQDCMLFYFHLVRNAFCRIHPHVFSLFQCPHIRGRFRRSIKKDWGDAIAGISDESKPEGISRNIKLHQRNKMYYT